MSTSIDCLPIDKLRKTDLYNLMTIFYDFKESGLRYGRKDHWNMSMVRLESWFDAIDEIIIDSDIKIRGDENDR